MCNLSDGVEARGIAKGIERGRAEGKTEAILSSIESLMKNTGWPMEQVMLVLNIPKSDYQRYADLLAKK